MKTSVYFCALETIAPHAAVVTYGQTWWPSYCEWIVPGTNIEEA